MTVQTRWGTMHTKLSFISPNWTNHLLRRHQLVQPLYGSNPQHLVIGVKKCILQYQGTNTFDPMKRRQPSIPVSVWCITCLILHGLTSNKDDTLAFTEICNRAKHHVHSTSRKKVYSHQNFGWAVFRSSDEENVWECSSFGCKTRLSHSRSMKTHIVGHQVDHNSYLRNRRHWELSLHREIVSFVWMVRSRETTA